jgi:hypothetical protein
MSCLPVPGLSRCHLLSSATAFSVILAVSRPGSPDIGAAVRFAVTFGAIRRRKSSPHPVPLAGRKRSATSQSPGRLQLGAPPRSRSRVQRRRAGSPFRSPPTQGCANGAKQSPGGCPAGKAVWPRLIITPGKLRGAM